MQRGDICLMYKDKHFFCAGKIICTFNSPEFATYLWQLNNSNAAWENMFLIDEMQLINIPIKSFNKTVGYKTNYIVQGYNNFEEQQSDIIIDEFSLYNWDTPSLISKSNNAQDNRNKILKALNELNSTDNISAGTKSRKEQSLLREHLFAGHNEGKCAICHKTLPINLLHAGHIKPRRDCSDEERKDLNIVMPICKLGCDDLYEKGYLLISDSGQIEANNMKKISGELVTFIHQYSGKQCTHHNELTKDYFTARNKINSDAR
jgi:hypothetical protein